MNDLLHTILTWLDHNRYLALSLAAALALSGWLVGCDPKTTSLLSPQQKVTVEQLGREVITVQANFDKRAALLKQEEAAYNADVKSANDSIDLAKADIAKQVALRTQLVEVAGGIGTAVATGGMTAPAAIGSVIQILGLLAAGGLGLDNLRKNAVISTLKTDLGTKVNT